MRFKWLLIIIYLENFKFIDCQDGFVTIFAPRVVYEKRTYSVVAVPTDIDNRIEIAVNFRSAFGTVALVNDVIQKVKVSNTKSSGAKPKFDLIVTLHRNMTTPSRETVPKCITRTLQEIESIKKMYYTFIQTDKPIYKPGDLVQFRIVVVDRDMKPFHFNNINVLICDPLSRTIKEFVDPEEMFIGVFTSNFTLSSSTPIGIWTVRVIIDNQNEYEETKTFAVEKFTLPPFSVHISTGEKNFLTNAKVPFSFYAKYSYGNFVRGSAKLTIRGTSNNHLYVTKVYNNVDDIFTVGLNIRDDLMIKTDEKLELEATVVFTEPESEISANNTAKFYVHVDQRMIIRPVHPLKFKPGLPFHVKVFPSNWNNKEILSHHEQVTIKYNYTFQDTSTRTDFADERVIDGVAMHEFIVPDDVISLELEITFVNTVYRKAIPIGETTIEVGKITVEHYPLNPKSNENVTIYARSDTEIDQVIVLIMSRHGHVESHKKNCDYKLVCAVTTRISNDMMPHATVIVYQIKNKKIIFRGESTITTADISSNQLDMDVQKSAKTRETINMKFKSKPGSKVYLLAYDKRLTYLRKGNEISKDNVVKSLEGYDTYNKIEVIPIENWKDCTTEELSRLQTGRKLIEQHSGAKDTYFAQESDDVIENLGKYKEKQRKTIRNANTEDDLREYFPETWIFDEFEMTKTSQTKSFKVPDSITSWMISAFAMNDQKGLAIAPTKEIMVKNEFFIKMSLPYSIRFKEILRLDILVYNYIEVQQDLEVTVKLLNEDGEEFQFVEFNGCTERYKSDEFETKSVTVPYNNVKRASFYIRSNVDKSIYEQRVKVIAEADGKIVGNQRAGSKKYHDIVGRYLKIEPIGVKKYVVQSKSKKLVQQQKNHDVYNFNSSSSFTEDDQEHPKFSVSISANYLSDSFNISSKFEYFPEDCLEQRTSKIKGNVEYYRYMLSKNKTLAKGDHFSEYFQSLLKQRDEKNWGYGNQSGYRAYFVDTIGTAMDIGLLPKQIEIIEKELDELKRKQNRNGSFDDFGQIPYIKDVYFQTAYIAHAFLKVKRVVRKSYTDIIAKSFAFLDDRSNMLQSSKQGLSMAAYAYALYGKKDRTLELLNEVEKEVSQITESQKCFKLKTLEFCDIRHSSYAALAYIKIDEKKIALPIFNWLLQYHNHNKYSSNTQSYAIATEAIAEMAKLLKALDTDFKVTLKNEAKFETTIHVTEKNMKETFEIEYPEYSRTVNLTASGKGFCSITLIMEKTITINETVSKFKVDVKQLSETLVQICATYKPGEELNAAENLNNVIYDVEMPSGHIFSKVVGADNIPEIKMVVERQRSKRVQIFYNGFMKDQIYCVEIKSNKINEVRNLEQVGVMIYDYDDKQNVAIEFYKPSSIDCYHSTTTTTTPRWTTTKTTPRWTTTQRSIQAVRFWRTPSTRQFKTTSTTTQHTSRDTFMGLDDY